MSHSPLTWMFQGRGRNNKINHLHECSLCIVYKDNNSSFKELLKKDNSFTVHHRNIQSLAIELSKIKANLSNTIINKILQTRTLPYNLRSNTDFARISVNTSCFGLNSLCYFASKVWNMMPSDIKNASNCKQNLILFVNKRNSNKIIIIIIIIMAWTVGSWIQIPLGPTFYSYFK